MYNIYIKMLSSIILFLPLTIFAQETKKIIFSPDFRAKDTKEIFYVLKSDTFYKQGLYQKITNKNVVIINGYYINDQKDSLWTEFNFEGKIKLSEGNYHKNKKVNVWEFYNLKGELEQKYDFTKNEIVFFKKEEKEYKVIIGTDTIKTKLERQPLYIGGDRNLNETISDNINYPPYAIANAVQGKVFISFTISKEGKSFHHKLTKGIGYDCNQEALRVAKLIPNNWIPARLNGEDVNVEYILPVSFKFQ